MLEQKLKDLMKEKARILDLQYTSITVAPHTGEFCGLGVFNHVLSVYMTNGDIVLTPGDLSKLPDHVIERGMEHEACHCKDYQEGMYTRELISIPDRFMSGIVLEMNFTYTDYFASQRQIRAFGQDKFDGFQNFGLVEFVQNTHRQFQDMPDPLQRLLTVAAFYKEQIKCDLMENDPGVMPPVIAEITEPFEDVFEKINASGLEWMDKSGLLFMVGFYVAYNVDPVANYQSGRLILGKGTKLSDELNSKGIFDARTLQIAKPIEAELDRRYAALANRS